MRRYYLETKQRVSYPNDYFERALLLNSPSEYISVNEDVDAPDIELSIELFGEKVFKRPKNSKYTKYKEIQEEDFINYFSVALDVLSGLKWKEEEAYLIQLDHSMYEIVLFSNIKTNSYYLHIEINYNLDSIYIQVYYTHKLSRRRHYREYGSPIPAEQFRYLLLKTVHYLEDNKNYMQNAKELFNDFSLTYQGKLEPVFPDNTINIQPLLTSLTNQIKQLEYRLMQNDNDRKTTREKIRGKIEGLKSAIIEIKDFAKSIMKELDN